MGPVAVVKRKLFGFFWIFRVVQDCLCAIHLHNKFCISGFFTFVVRTVKGIYTSLANVHAYIYVEWLRPTAYCPEKRYPTKCVNEQQAIAQPQFKTGERRLCCYMHTMFGPILHYANICKHILSLHCFYNSPEARGRGRAKYVLTSSQIPHKQEPITGIALIIIFFS